MREQRLENTAQRAVLQAAAAVLEVDPRDVLGSISPDQTLADYVSENGGDLSAVTNDARAALVSHLEETVSNQQISQEDADALLATLDDALESALNTAGAFQMRSDDGRDGRNGRNGRDDPPQQNG